MIKYDLIITIVNRGFADEVMSAAKKVGAFGGTIINARGTGSNELKEFFGAIIQPEKELVLILTQKEKRNEIMTAICKYAGLDKEGMGISFSLPVDAVAGIRAFKDDEVNNEHSEAD